MSRFALCCSQHPRHEDCRLAKSKGNKWAISPLLQYIGDRESVQETMVSNNSVVTVDFPLKQSNFPLWISVIPWVGELLHCCPLKAAAPPDSRHPAWPWRPHFCWTLKWAAHHWPSDVSSQKLFYVYIYICICIYGPGLRPGPPPTMVWSPQAGYAPPDVVPPSPVAQHPVT